MNINKAMFTRFMDQFGRERLHVQLGEKSATVTFNELWGDPKLAMIHLAASSIFIPDSHAQLKKLASALTLGPPRYIIDRTGWHNGSFALGDGSIIAPNSYPSLPVEFPIDVEGWAQSGTLENWKTLMGPLLVGQAFPRFALAVSLSPSLISLTDLTGNITVDISGESSSGKTTLLDLAASAWGPPSFVGRTHFPMTWHTTVHGLGIAMDRHNDALLAIDELNALGETGSERGSRTLLKSAIFTLSAGVQKTSAHNVAPVTSRFVALSTSNSPLAQTVGNESDGVAKAASVRMISIPADSGSPYKTFDSVPKGCKDIPAAIVKLKSAMRVQHGTVARAFITQLVKERAEGELLLKQKIAELMSAFLKKAGNPTDGAAHRVAEWFALFHAANTLALEWEVLPKGWKHDYVSTIYRRYLDAAAKLDPKPPLNFLAEYAREHDLPSFLANDSTSSKKRATALAEKGFIDKGPEGGRVMVLPASFRSSPLALPALHAAKAIGALATDGGKGRTLQAKRTIAGKSVRCFVVQLHVVKAELKTLSTRR